MPPVTAAAAVAAAVTEFGDPTDEGVRTAVTPMAAGRENDPEPRPPDFGAPAVPHPDSDGVTEPIDPIDIIPIVIGRRASGAPSHADKSPSLSSPPSAVSGTAPPVVGVSTATRGGAEPAAAAVPGRDNARRSSAAARPLLRMDPTLAACLWRCRSRSARAARALAWVWILTAASASRCSILFLISEQRGERAMG